MGKTLVFYSVFILDIDILVTLIFAKLLIPDIKS